MKKVIGIAAFTLFSIALSAQDEKPAEEGPWKKSGLFNLSVSQTNLVNWAAGGQNSISGVALFQYSAHYKKGLWTWKNDLTLTYGGLAQGETAWQKTDDRIEFNTNISKSKKEGGSWACAGFLNFRTQFVDGFKLPDDSTIISTWMAPGYLTAGIGMDYAPNENFSMSISPIASKLTFVANEMLADAGAFGVKPAVYDSITGEKTENGASYQSEFGGNISMQFKKELVKNVELDTKLNLFSNYLDRPGNIDVNWDVLLNMKVNNWLSASLICNLIYDHDIDIAIDSNNDGVTDGLGPRTQFKETFGIGLNMTF